MTSTLFICRQGNDANIGVYGYFRKFSGLFNSARLMVEMLNKNGIKSAIETAQDNNCIDRLVTKHKPTHCIIEAYWVVPEKFEILTKLHPNVTWIIRIHSETPFWSTEGVAMDWSLRYLDYKNIILAPNAKRLDKDLRTALSVKYDADTIAKHVVYLPNYYPADKRHDKKGEKRNKDELHVGCFGAIRPLKNQLTQAMAAIKYAEDTGRKLVYHINGNRVEGNGDPIIKNIRKLFEHSTNGFELVEHAWQPHKSFLEVLKNVDIGLQVSYTESFNIVSADLVTMDVPVVVSDEISWVNRLFFAKKPSNVNSIVNAMRRAEFFGRFGSYLNRRKLALRSAHAEAVWVDYFNWQDHLATCKKKA
jgi:hypothetical protein